MKRITLIPLSFACALFFSNCASTESVGRVKPTGKLGDSSSFQPENGDKGTLVWVDSAANFSKFTKVFIRPVYVHGRSEEDKEDKLSSADRKLLSDYFDTVLKRELGKDYTIVSSASPGTLDFQYSITRVSKSIPLLDTATTLYPTSFLYSHAKKQILGTHAFTGRASMELEVKDGGSKKRVIAVISARTGGKNWANKFDKWKDAKASMNYWAIQARERLAKLRGA